jgi:hypothetical protein
VEKMVAQSPCGLINIFAAKNCHLNFAMSVMILETMNEIDLWRRHSL